MKTTLQRIDRKFGQKIKTWPKQLRPFMYIMTTIGQPVFTVAFASYVMFYGLKYSNHELLWAGTVSNSTMLIGFITKQLLRRKRPGTEYVDRMWFKTYSMPSGHAVCAMVAYGMIPYLILHLLPLWAGLLVTIAVTFIIVSIGVSRIYLGAHYPSDVIAGWAMGAVGLVAIVVMFQLAV